MPVDILKGMITKKPGMSLSKTVAIATMETVDEKGNALSPTDEQYVYLECQFNPDELKITKSVSWSQGKLLSYRNTPDLDFGGGKPAEFSLKLIFDTTGQVGLTGKTQDVRLYTNQLFRLVMMFGDEDLRMEPPRVKFEWGAITLFLAVVTKVQVTYTLFNTDGTPVRAKADVDFIQMDQSDDPASGQNPTTRTEPRKTRRVQQGERLDFIAYQEYGNSAHWRYLAEVNGIYDPRALQPGQILVIPPLP